MADTQKSPAEQTGSKRRWLLVVPALALLAVVFLGWIFTRGTPSNIFPPGEKVAPVQQDLPKENGPASPQTPPAAPKVSAPPLKDQLQQVVAGMREANQQKDLSKLLSYYSPNFPGLTQRTQSISKVWKTYDYPRIDFEITDIKPLDDKAVLARVTWEAEAKNISTQKSMNTSKTYLIKFVKESGQWRIQALEDAK